MIKVCNINESANFSGEVIAIVRRFHEPGDIRQLDVLSPSEELLGRYLEARESGSWSLQEFQRWYVPDFINQLAHDEEAKGAIRRLIEEADQKDRCLVCFCEDEQICHRSIIAGILQSCKVPIVGVARDYSEYGKMLRTAMHGRWEGHMPEFNFETPKI